MGTAPANNVRYIRVKKNNAAPTLGLWLFLLICSMAVTYFFLHSAVFNIATIEIAGNKILKEEEIIEQSGLTKGVNIFKAKAGEAALKLKMLPRIEKVEITRKLPASLLIAVTERVPQALVVSAAGFIEVDRDGIYLERTNELKDINLPLISGVTVAENLQPGDSLLTPGLRAALDLIEIIDEDFMENVAEISAPSSLSLMLKTTQGVEVRFGEPVDLERKIQVMQGLLFENGEIINSETVEYIDLRYNTAPVIKRKK